MKFAESIGRLMKPGRKFNRVYDNNVDAFIPELWANEGLIVLVENMVAGNLVYRDFENVVAAFGDLVHTRRPADFVAKRKMVTDNVVIQDAIATDVQVPLDQHIHVSFLIRDGEESKSFKDLVDEFLTPAIVAQARMVDQIVLGQYAQFLSNNAGSLGGLTADNGVASLLAAREVLNINKAPMTDRALILNPVTESTLLSVLTFIEAQKVGDQGQAIREASLGRKFGMDTYMDQNMAVVAGGNSTTADTINHSGGYPAGTSSFVLTTGTSAGLVAGNWFTIAGDKTPLQIATWTSGSKTVTTVTPSKAAVADTGAVTIMTPGAVDNVAGYPAGYSKEITVEDFTVAPQVGQIVSFGTETTHAYTIIGVNGMVGITLDRPLVNALADEDPVNLGPAGNFNFAFHKNAIALVSRPLARPRPGTGALSAVVNWNDLSMRSTITYDGSLEPASLAIAA